MSKIIKFHFSNDRVITVNSHEENIDIFKIINKQWFVNLEPMTKKYTCINLGKVIFTNLSQQ